MATRRFVSRYPSLRVYWKRGYVEFHGGSFDTDDERLAEHLAANVRDALEVPGDKTVSRAETPRVSRGVKRGGRR